MKLDKDIPFGKQPRKERTSPREPAVVTRIRSHPSEWEGMKKKEKCSKTNLSVSVSPSYCNQVCYSD